MRDLAQLSIKDLSLVLSLLSASHHTTPVTSLSARCAIIRLLHTMEIIIYRSMLSSARRVHITTQNQPGQTPTSRPNSRSVKLARLSIESAPSP
jgi:hypothetical protein